VCEFFGCDYCVLLTINIVHLVGFIIKTAVVYEFTRLHVEIKLYKTKTKNALNDRYYSYFYVSSLQRNVPPRYIKISPNRPSRPSCSRTSICVTQNSCRLSFINSKEITRKFSLKYCCSSTTSVGC